MRVTTRVPLLCREFVEFLDDYADGSLPSDQLARFNAHLAACPSCVAYMRSYRQVSGLARAAWRPEGPLPADAPEELVQAILSARRGS
jgi:anti-sigma factor RsiW